MGSRIITISYTGIDDDGGVPKFNRDIRDTFLNHQHFCWSDYPYCVEVDEHGQTEWGRARILNDYLLRTRKVTADDIVIADGFWAAGLEYLPKAISVAHGIWSHRTKADIESGDLTQDMPYHHAAQVAFRRRWFELGKRTTAVSDFIAEQLKLQWNFSVDRVINNGVDTSPQYDIPIAERTGLAPLSDYEKPPQFRHGSDMIVVLHGVNDRANLNKGWSHIEKLNQRGIETITYDDLCDQMVSGDDRFPDRHSAKICALGCATVFVHPSGFEGNSMMVAEALAMGVPIVGYDVGYLASRPDYPGVIDRKRRSPEVTADVVQKVLANQSLQGLMKQQSREIAVTDLDIKHFKKNWQEYVDFVEGKTSC